MIQIITGFNLQTETPIDSRIVVANDTERNNISSAYHGLRVWEKDTNTPYFWNGGTWVSELDLVVTGEGTKDIIPKFETTNTPSKLIDSQISDDGVKVSIVGDLEVGGQLEFIGNLVGNMDAGSIGGPGKLDLQYLDNDGSEGDVLLLDGSLTPKWDSVKNISIGTSETTKQVKINPINADNDYRIILSNMAEAITSIVDLELSSYANGLVIRKSTGSSYVCVLSHGGSETNPPYSFYDITSTTSTPLGGMYYSGDSIGFSIGGVPQLKIKNDGIYIEPDTTNSGKFTNVKNSIGVPVGGIIMWSGDESDIGIGDLWNYMLCDNSTVSGPFTDNYGTSFTPTYVGSTPNLVNKFIIAAGGIYDTNDEGGEDDISLDVGNIPSHTHSFTGIDVSGETNEAGEHSHNAQAWTHNIGGVAKGVLDFKSVNKNAQQDGVTDSKESIKNDGLHKHTFSAEISGSTDGGSGTSGNSFDNRPRFFALAFIIRVV